MLDHNRQNEVIELDRSDRKEWNTVQYEND